MRTAEDLLAAVQCSPDAVAIHDRATWVDLYAREGVVNDPVGSKPHRGREAIERFYDTFIAPNTINFHIENDFVCGMSVVRDLSLETIMSTGAVLNVPMHIRYDLVEEDGELKISRLAAHWELRSMIGQLLSAGSRGLIAGAKLTPQLIGNQGIAGALGFMGGLRSVGAQGREAAAELLKSSPMTDALGQPVSSQVLRGATYRKFLAAGRTVSVTMDGSFGSGVVFIEFAPTSLDAESITVFASDRDT
ncbi:hypothetical protein A2J03_01015 [Rhodococcus sp. EPR-157]|uniref:nuclear transport factor 2 family protein n=1 Tax=Rhodococcus sp. EPR-157 TaxID=1813677 RepID=UPI0007BC443D|nr:nuclear transport factor 2 family protein [Rhodococcus sp. EPR-157]KZF10322.1 hypothetical protein A2J03_01015 [Rhodococcus sp. EPR-157]